MEIFFATHDPTTLNRQGNDIGTQYRSEIFYHNEEQKKISEDYIALMTKENTFGKPIVTKFRPLQNFMKPKIIIKIITIKIKHKAIVVM